MKELRVSSSQRPVTSESEWERLPPTNLASNATLLVCSLQAHLEPEERNIPTPRPLVGRCGSKTDGATRESPQSRHRPG